MVQRQLQEVIARIEEALPRSLGKDVLISLREGIRKGRTKEGVFYRCMDEEELKAWSRGNFPLYTFASNDKKDNEKVYGCDGLMQVEISGRAVPYVAGESLLFDVYNVRVIKRFG